MSGKILQFNKDRKPKAQTVAEDTAYDKVEQILDDLSLLVCVLDDRQLSLWNGQEEIEFTPHQHLVILGNEEGKLVIQHSAESVSELEDMILQVLDAIRANQEEEEIDG